MPEPYNPLDKINLGKSVVDALLEQTSIRLSSVSNFSGAGIYALYYDGAFPAYQPISRNPDGEDAIPIYAGKAVPAGARKGASLIPAIPQMRCGDVLLNTETQLLK
jgi:Eco29kI restriction endonuclease